MKFIVSTGAVAAAAGVLGILGAGTASAAPDVEGMTYEDAVAAIEEDGGIPKIAVTVGDRQDAMGDCLVERVTDGSFVRPIPEDVYFGPDEGDVLLTLNCNRGVATATTPGASAASVSGREFQAKVEEAAAAEAEEAEAAEAE
ncbi:hypothetical protein [Mycobacterium sp. ITM-2016-00318]|uniref:hypothetical protein n=1 Tax=Mycobacterium sp. ITM-2016-00318 TaxID=2099693 RepID=UPI001E30DCAD|nr:hypothetical protein [Mycobacterium sp. ITM-2016-00318]WNG92237.1 hypothetical protein C6A82_022935 [Mycobacterium sp. ITM-2016-00318]